MTAAARPAPRDLPLLPTLLCLLAARTVTSFVVGAVLGGGVNPSFANSLFTYLVVEGFFAALIGAFVIRGLLDKVFGFDVSYRNAFVALAAGSFVSITFVWATSTAVQQSGNPYAMPSGGIFFTFVPLIGSVGVAYWLLQRGVRGRTAVRPDPGRAWDPREESGSWAEEMTTTRTVSDTAEFASYDQLVSAARETALGLVDSVSRVSPEDVTGLIGERLPMLQAITTNLENTTPPIAVPKHVHTKLIAGLKQLQEDLVDTATSAVTTAGQRITQRGVFLPGSADVSDGGARYRWELSLSPGLKTIKEAFTELAALGIATSW
jgi:hypothetical protein